MLGTIVLTELLEHVMTRLNISHTELAQVVGASERTVVRWLADETYPQHDSRDRLDRLVELTRRLDETFTTAEGSAAWLRAPSGYFGGLAPLNALLHGRIDLVDAALEALDAGVFV